MQPGTEGIARPRIDPGLPFESTQTFRRFGVRVAPAANGEHEFMKALIHEQGFDGLPHVVTESELDSFAAAGEVILFRGVSAVPHAEQLRAGDLYVGQGGLGGGIYAFGSPDGYELARAYAQDAGSAVMRMAVKTGARLVHFRTVLAAMQRDRDELLLGSQRYGAGRLAVSVLTQVPSVYACYLGYDGIVDEHNSMWLIFNRTALRIQVGDIIP